MISPRDFVKNAKKIYRFLLSFILLFCMITLKTAYDCLFLRKNRNEFFINLKLFAKSKNS